MRLHRLSILACALACASPTLGEEQQPVTILDAYFDAIVAGETADAFDFLMTHSKVDEIKPREIEMVKGQVQQVMGLYGKPFGYEQISSVRYGSFIHRFVYITRHEDVPIVWTFLFYRGSSAWELLKFDFNDQQQKLQ